MGNGMDGMDGIDWKVLSYVTKRSSLGMWTNGVQVSNLAPFI